jgi:hypothetical protein
MFYYLHQSELLYLPVLVVSLVQAFFLLMHLQMWEKVKSGNPSMGVCEISAAIGRMWRELGAEEKQRHNDDYTVDKVRAEFSGVGSYKVTASSKTLRRMEIIFSVCSACSLGFSGNVEVGS